MILALDVGFRSLGYAVFDTNGDPVACGVIRTEKSSKKLKVRTADDNALRAGKIARELKEVIDTHQVRGIVGELPSGGAQSARAMSQMSMATAIVATICELCDLPSEWATPADVKVALTGSKTASKDECMDAARRCFQWKGLKVPGAKAEFEHIADACGAFKALATGNLVRLICRLETCAA